MFSVIIPLYNKANYLIKALDSVFGQTFNEFEVIVVNDGSTDESLKVLLDFSNRNLYNNLVILDQENLGVSLARNNGVKKAKYPYICFLDADDWWEPTFLEEMDKLIKGYSYAGIYGSSYFKVKAGKFITANIGVDDSFKEGEINYLRTYAKTMWMPLWTGSVVIPKSIFLAENGFKANLRLGEDFDLWIRIALKYKTIFINKPLAYYNQDVDAQARGVVNFKIYKPGEHFIFNLAYLEDIEEVNEDLKKLLDILRAYTLVRYRLSGSYPEEYIKEIEKVDFEKLTPQLRNNYTTPVWLLKLRFSIKRIISDIIDKVKK